MALFRRKKTDSVLPEVDEYYQAERRDRGWLAWVLAFVSVAVVALVIIGLFLGGRWAYNKIANNDDEVAVTDNNGTNDEGLTVDGQPSGDSGTADNADGTNASDDGSNGNESTNSQGSNANSSNQSGSSSNNTNATNSSGSATTPVTGDSTENLPNTGPADLAGIFVGVTALAGGAHYAVSRKRATNRF